MAFGSGNLRSKPLSDGRHHELAADWNELTDAVDLVVDADEWEALDREVAALRPAVENCLSRLSGSYGGLTTDLAQSQAELVERIRGITWRAIDAATRPPRDITT
ncbi:MAG TPA: hypothetical protein VF712_18345 [Thermoleophilaceae bacterium]|jgi:hypothetical protein